MNYGRDFTAVNYLENICIVALWGGLKIFHCDQLVSLV